MSRDTTSPLVRQGGRIYGVVEKAPAHANGDPGLAFGTVGVRQVINSVASLRPTAPRISVQHVSFKRLDKELPSPAPAHEGDAGFDLRAATAVKLEPGERAAVPTGVAVAIPPGFAGLVLPRSGHARNHGIGLVNSPGLIDSGYRGEVTVLLVNHGSETVSFERGDRIAQLAVVPVPGLVWQEVDELDGSSRGEGGFGSTGY